MICCPTEQQGWNAYTLGDYLGHFNKLKCKQGLIRCFQTFFPQSTSKSKTKGTSISQFVLNNNNNNNNRHWKNKREPRDLKTEKKIAHLCLLIFEVSSYSRIPLWRLMPPLHTLEYKIIWCEKTPVASHYLQKQMETLPAEIDSGNLEAQASQGNGVPEK